MEKELLNFLEFCQRLFFCSCYLGFCFSIHHLSFNKHYFYTSSTAPLWCSPWFVRQAGRVEDIFISLREAALSKNVEKSKIEATLLKPLLAISAIAAVHLPTVYGLIGLRDVNAPHCSIDTEGGGRAHSTNRHSYWRTNEHLCLCKTLLCVYILPAFKKRYFVHSGRKV